MSRGTLAPVHERDAATYDVRVVGGVLRREIDGSTDRCAWFGVDEAQELALTDLGRHALALVTRSS